MRYYQATLSLVDMTTEIYNGSSHKDLMNAETAKSEKQVIKTIEAIKSFIDPFDVEDHQKLYCLPSSVAADMETAEDVLRADKVGIEMKETYISPSFSRGVEPTLLEGFSLITFEKKQAGNTKLCIV